MNDKWYDNLRGRMEAHREIPPEGLWDDIERAMDRAAAFRSRRRRILYWGGGAAAAAVTALFFLVGDGGVETNIVEPLIPAVASEYSQTSPEREMPVGEVYAATVKKAVVERRSAGIVSGGEESFAYEIVTISDGKTTREPPVEYTPVGEGVLATEDAPSEEKHSGTGNPPREEKGSSPENVRPTDNFGAVLANDIPKSKRRRWQAGLYASNLASTGAASSIDRSPAMAADADATFYYDHAGLNNSVGQNLIRFDAGRTPLYTDTSHSLPVTVGVSIAYGLGERWSLASGVNWTMLTSRSRNTRGTFDESRKQVLHYIGIPLDVKFNIWSGSALSFYLSAGGQVEKSVSGKETFTLLSGDEGNPARTGNSISDRAQWSIRGSAGAQYDFTQTTGIYVEPGVNYYFDNGSAIETVYKAKPLNFGLRLGLRFSL